MDRDTLDWVVDIGAAVGGIASLVAVVIAVVSLKHARKLQEEVFAERRRERIRRRLGRLQETALEVTRLATALGETSFTTSVLHCRQLRVLLQVSGLRGDALAIVRKNGSKSGRPIGNPNFLSVSARTEARILELREAGLSFRLIAERLNDERVPTAQGGKRWHSQTVANVVARLSTSQRRCRYRRS